MSARVVPVGYILTDDALQELVTADPEWQRLDGEWQQATGDAKAKARHEAKELQDEITTKLFKAVKSLELPAIALKRTKSGDWIEHQLPDHLLEDMDGDLALWTGSVTGMGLDPEDRWIADAPFCFRRVEFERWRRKPSAAFRTPLQVSAMSRIIPTAYVLTDEAIEELVGADPHHRRLKAEWLAATADAKEKAYVEVCQRQNQITDRLYEAVKSDELQPVALVRTLAGGWDEHGIPKRYRESLGGELALWRGSVETMELEPGDEWIRKSALCFRRSDFDPWLVTAIVIRPPGAQTLPTWWTVPEATVWIAARDLSKVDSLDARARASLFVASEVIPGTYEASFELLAGLRAGRLLAWGWPRGQQSSGVSQLIPQDFWKAPTEFSESEIGVEGLRGPGDAMVGLLLQSDDVMAKWESPRSLLDGEKIPLGTFIDRLMHESWPAYLLRHREVVATGLNHLGQRVEIDKDVFQTNATIDRAAHSVRTADGRLHWSAAMVELRKVSEPATSPPAKDDGKRFIAFAQAAYRVHRALCGHDTITGLTSRERWLVTLDFQDAGMKDLVDEWQEAVNRDELWQHQCEEANDWLKSRGLEGGKDGLLDRAQFEEVFAVAFPDGANLIESRRAANPETMKIEPLIAPQKAPTFLSDLEIIALARPVIERIAANGQQLRRRDFEPLLRELAGDRLPWKADDRLWPVLAPSEWREGGKRPKGKLVDDWRPYLKSGGKPI